MSGESKQAVRLARETAADSLHNGGTVTHRVYLAGRWVGWVGDGRNWRGAGYGARKWWACWREDGDTAARWNDGLVYPTRKDAVAALVQHIGQAQP